MSIKEQCDLVKNSLVEYPNAKVVVATKYMTIEQTEELYKNGFREFGENRTDMFLEKYEYFKKF